MTVIEISLSLAPAEFKPLLSAVAKQADICNELARITRDKEVIDEATALNSILVKLRELDSRLTATTDLLNEPKKGE